MADDDQTRGPAQSSTAPRRSRRDFVALSTAAAASLATGGASAASAAVVEKDVTVKTPDGSCDAAFIYPATGVHAGVLVWPDAFGLRKSMRAIGRRLAAAGFAALVPNPFYRVARAPMFESAAWFDFGNPEHAAKLRPLMASLNPSGVERDAVAHVAFLDAQPQVDKTKKIGTQGYCMGGAMVVRAAAAAPGRVGAGASFHGGGLVTDQPDSPHLLAPKIQAHMYFGVASNDDERQPDAKDKLRAAFAAVHVPCEVVVYPARHGWCVPDMPTENGAPIYSEPEAERAWRALMALYKSAL